jgi:hypothetical protein
MSIVARSQRRGSRRCRERALAATNAHSAASFTRIEFSTRTCSSDPLAHSLYTVAVQTRSRSATSRTSSILLFSKYR